MQIRPGRRTSPQRTRCERSRARAQPALQFRGRREALAGLPGVQIDRARQLISAVGSKGFAVSAAPTSDGGVCIASPVGGGCFPRFEPDGVAIGTGMDNDGPASPSDRELLAGVASDRVSSITVLAGARHLPVQLRNGGFIYESPEVGLWADALLIGFGDGSSTRVAVGNANRPEGIPCYRSTRRQRSANVSEDGS